MPAQPLRTLFEVEDLTLARSREMRPMLARVLTDLFVQAPGRHSAAEVDRYGTLMSSLYEDLDPSTRALLATRLTGRPEAPAGLMARLAADVSEVAAGPIRSGALGEATLLDLLRTGDVPKRRAVAARPDLSADIVLRLCTDLDESVLAALIANEAATLGDTHLRLLANRVLKAPELASALLRRADVPGRAAAPLFLHADAAGRAKILAALVAPEGRAAAAAPRSPAAELRADVADVLVAHAKAGRREGIAAVLAEVMPLPRAMADRVLQDEGGEALVIALRALRLAETPTLTLLLLANPAIGCSVERVFALVKLSAELPNHAADHMTALWRGGERVRPSAPGEIFRPSRRVPEARPRAAASGEGASLDGSVLRRAAGISGM